MLEGNRGLCRGSLFLCYSCHTSALESRLWTMFASDKAETQSLKYHSDDTMNVRFLKDCTGYRKWVPGNRVVIVRGRQDCTTLRRAGIFRSHGYSFNAARMWDCRDKWDLTSLHPASWMQPSWRQRDNHTQASRDCVAAGDGIRRRPGPRSN